MRNSMKPLIRLAAAFALIAFTSNALAGEPSPAIFEAVWLPQTIAFTYRSEGRRYSCDVLAYKIAKIVRRLGARDEMEIRGVTCQDLSTQARFEISIASPVEATQQNIQRVTEYSSEDVLIARLHSAKLASSAEIERFPASWETISFWRNARLDIDSGDCALIQQLRRQVLPRMSIHVTKDIANVDCSQELSGIGLPRFAVQALVPVSSLQ